MKHGIEWSAFPSFLKEPYYNNIGRKDIPITSVSLKNSVHIQ